MADAGAVVEEALGDATLEQELVVAVGPAVGFVADALEEFERAGFMREDDGVAFTGNKDFFPLFGEADDGESNEAEALEFCHGDAELAFAAVHDDEVWEADPLGFWIFDC